ncbi:MAG: hypothetical protein WC455_16815 [Dehalococcoidia bacterium]|jgi:hypothetical protein
MKVHHNIEHADINGVLPEEHYAPPRMIVLADGKFEFIESCSECSCLTRPARGKPRCTLIERVYWKPSSGISAVIVDRTTIHNDCPLPFYKEVEK